MTDGKCLYVAKYMVTRKNADVEGRVPLLRRSIGHCYSANVYASWVFEYGNTMNYDRDLSTYIYEHCDSMMLT